MSPALRKLLLLAWAVIGEWSKNGRSQERSGVRFPYLHDERTASNSNKETDNRKPSRTVNESRQCCGDTCDAEDRSH